MRDGKSINRDQEYTLHVSTYEITSQWATWKRRVKNEAQVTSEWGGMGVWQHNLQGWEKF